MKLQQVSGSLAAHRIPEENWCSNGFFRYLQPHPEDEAAELSLPPHCYIADCVNMQFSPLAASDVSPSAGQSGYTNWHQHTNNVSLLSRPVYFSHYFSKVT